MSDRLKEVIREMLADESKKKLTTALEDLVVKTLDEMEVEYVFDLASPGRTCYFCGMGDAEFTVGDKSFHAECVYSRGF